MATVTVGESVSPAEAPAAPIERPDFESVPRRGLILVGAVLVLLIAAIAANKLWPLAFFHFVGGASWTIIDLFLGFVLGADHWQAVGACPGGVHHPADAEDGADHADRGDGHAGRGLAARGASRNRSVELLPARLDGGELHRGRGDGGDRPGTARAREHRRAG